MKTKWPGGLNNILEEPDWGELEWCVDSGTTETVIGDTVLRSIRMTESPGPKAGVTHTVANMGTIPDLGQQTFRGETEEGIERELTAQVAEVDQALMSVTKMV